MEKIMLESIIGANIARYREMAGMIQAQLAEKIGTSIAFISRVERGEKMMKVHTLYSTAQALSISCDALLYVDGPAVQMENIKRILAEQPSEYLAGLEKLIRICVEEFEPRLKTPTDL